MDRSFRSPVWQALERRELGPAVACLRGELATQHTNAARVHELAACLLCATADELHDRAKWPGPAAGSRARVLQALQVRAQEAHASRVSIAGLGPLVAPLCLYVHACSVVCSRVGLGSLMKKCLCLDLAEPVAVFALA